MNVHRMSACLIVGIALLSIPVTLANADEVTLIPGAGGYPTGAEFNALAGPLFASDLDSVDVPGPGSATATATLGGNVATHVNTVELDFSGGAMAFFDSAYGGPLSAFGRTATLDERASAESIFHFSVDVPTEFEIMGSFGVADAVGTTVPGNVEFEIELLEFDDFGMPPTVVFYNWQVSKETIDQTFFVGSMDGDSTNSLIGDPFGILDPAKVYRYRTLVTSVAIDIDGSDPLPATDGAATAMGAHVITFDAFTAIPEPSSGALLAAILLPLLVRRRRK